MIVVYSVWTGSSAPTETRSAVRAGRCDPCCPPRSYGTARPRAGFVRQRHPHALAGVFCFPPADHVVDVGNMVSLRERFCGDPPMVRFPLPVQRVEPEEPPRGLIVALVLLDVAIWVAVIWALWALWP